MAELDRIAATEDLDALMDYIAEDCVTLAPYEPSLVGADAIEDWYRDFYASFDVVMQHQPGETHVIGDLMIHRGTAVSTVTPTEGGPAVPFDNKYLMLLRRTQGGLLKFWRVAYNSNMPPAIGG
jgi:ketosteroid isomerase-like protein